MYINNIEITKSNEIANEFAKHFSTVGKQYAEQIPTPVNDIEQYLAQIRDNHNSIFMSPVGSAEIEKIIDMSPNKYSSGHDNLSNILLNN